MNKGVLFSLLYVCCFTAAAQTKIADILNYGDKVEKISIKSEELAYVDEGAGEKTLLFVHGLSSNLEAWSKNISHLKSRYRCVAIDLPGYGKSSKNKADYSLVEYAAYIDEFINKKELRNIVLVGHSMGGQIAIHTLLNYPKHFEKLILIAPAGIETFTLEETAVMKGSYTPEIVLMASDEQIRNNFHLNFYSFPEEAEFMVRDRIAMKKASDFETYTKVVVNSIHAMLNEPVIGKIDQISVPVLLIYGKNDLLIPNKYFHPGQSIELLVEIAEERISDLKVELIDEAGHFVNFEKSAEVNSSIIDFMQSE